MITSSASSSARGSPGWSKIPLSQYIDDTLGVTFSYPRSWVRVPPPSFSTASSAASVYPVTLSDMMDCSYDQLVCCNDDSEHDRDIDNAYPRVSFRFSLSLSLSTPFCG